MSHHKKIALIGAGKMGEGLLGGILAQKKVLPDAVTIFDKVSARMGDLKKAYGINIAEDIPHILAEAEIVILGVKPQDMGCLLAEIKPFFKESILVVSIAAGVTTAFIESALEGKARVIRMMPNMPALIGCGATALSKGEHATDADIAAVLDLSDAIGLSVVVPEDLMDAVTGLSGCGPAYGFIMIEALADAGVLMGLPRAASQKLAAQTILGAASLCLQGEAHPAALKDMIASPGGATIAGIKALEEGNFRASLIKAVEAACVRSRSLLQKG
ncbi:MAG: pyrroline-5-carboxylate reductase [Syntrophobacterales bacterium]|jgi:pyrroline-5-carboxylate reductase|nr:pyrroline-5-carboxylate reductase [Syntrophobacterales bacterium]